MRPLLAGLLLSGLAFAAPSVRWIDDLGDPHTEAIAEVLVETGERVKVRYTDGKEAIVPVARLIRLVRERDDRPDEQRLLGARLDVAAGLRLDAARQALDGLLAGKRTDWLREYAEAARALLAERAGEKDALERIDRFLVRHPGSRFHSELVLARARLRAEAEEDVETAIGHFMEAHQAIEKSHGSLVARYRTFADSAAWIARHAPTEADFFMSGVESRVRASLERNQDLALHTAAEAGLAWARLAHHAHLARECVAGGHPPRGEMAAVGRLSRRTWILAEARCDLLLELARLQHACERSDAALATLKEAHELAPGPRRREIAGTLKARIGRGEALLAPPDK